MDKQVELLPAYDPRFLERHLGKDMLQNPKIAIIELISNSWDAGATSVDIIWPDNKGSNIFRITDNGSGLNEDKFKEIWNMLHYNRKDDIGLDVIFPDEFKKLPRRKAYGKNGKGRFSAFVFSKKYSVIFYKDGMSYNYLVERVVGRHPFKIHKKSESSINKEMHGLEITALDCDQISIDEEQVRAEIGMRFLADTNFKVSVNNRSIKFEDIPDENITVIEGHVEGIGDYTITVIDTSKADKNTQRHGIAWHVNNRLVGECTWKGAHIDKRYIDQKYIDGRSTEAKRYVFIVKADFLAETDSVKQDWTGFNNTDSFIKTSESVGEEIRNFLLTSRKGKIKKNTEGLKAKYASVLNKLSLKERDMWNSFVYNIQENCPTLGQEELDQAASILAKLEQANSRYSLLSQIDELAPDQMDELNNILGEWSLAMAKKVLDSIKERMLLLKELNNKTSGDRANEVKELQPLFHQGLWIFGPEFETIHYTSNEGMTNVANKIFNKDLKASANRPDFVITHDSSIGFYSYPSYDNEGGEIGVDSLVIVELKAPQVPIGRDEKEQCWKYVRELLERGLITKSTKVRCFACGKRIKPFEDGVTEENGGQVQIIPMLYSTIVSRAHSRLLNLYKQVEDAPFLSDEDKVELKVFVENSADIPHQQTLNLGKVDAA